MAVGRDRAEGLRTAWKNIQVILHSDPATQDRHLNATQELFYITITLSYAIYEPQIMFDRVCMLIIWELHQ